MSALSHCQSAETEHSDFRVKAQGALVRSRFRNIMQMGAPSKFLFGLGRKNGQPAGLREEFFLDLIALIPFCSLVTSIDVWKSTILASSFFHFLRDISSNIESI